VPQINVSDADREWFDSFKESDETHAEAFSRMVSIVRAYEGEPVDHEELAGELEKTLIPMVEVAAFRGTKECVEGDE